MKSLAGTRVLVTGGAGMIGSHIVDRLIDVGAIPSVIDTQNAYPFDYRRRFLADDIDVVTGDVRDRSALVPALLDVTHVIHAAAFADVAGCVNDPTSDFEHNIRGTQTLLEESARVGVQRLVFVSSASVYGDGIPGERRMFSEDHRPAPISTYGNSKLWGETQTILYGRSHAMGATSLRYFSIYGPRQVPKFGSHSWCVACFVMRALKNLPLVVNGDGSQLRDFIDVRDVARATVQALSADAALGQCINVGTGRPTSVLEVAQRIGERFGGVEIRHAERPAGDPRGGWADTRKMRSLLGFEPTTSLGDGLDEYLRWARDNIDLVPDWL